jgi:hypothetical protein
MVFSLMAKEYGNTGGEIAGFQELATINALPAPLLRRAFHGEL